LDKPVIMCVDDELQILQSLTRDLSSEYGDLYDIEICESAEEALEVRETLHSEGRVVSIYIVDQRMPGMKGIEFLKKIKEEAGKILLTAYSDIEVAIEGINHKCIDFYMLKPYGTNLFKNINYLRFSNRSGAFVTLARTPEERASALEVQNTVFSEEHLGLPYEKGIEIIGNNPYEEKAEIFVAVSDRQIIGTTSINRRDEDFAQKYGTICGLPIEEFYDISNLATVDTDLVQVRNATVLPEFQNRRIGPMIWGEIYRELTSCSASSEYAVILAASEIRDPRIAGAVFQKILNDGLYDNERAVTLKTKNGVYYDKGWDKFSYETQGAVLPRLLKMYSKMNFRFIGEPVYYENYKMFDFPMLLKISEVAEPYKTWFETGRL